MTVEYLKKALEEYKDTAEVILVDWSTGREYEPSIGSDDEDEFVNYCRIGF